MIPIIIVVTWVATGVFGLYGIFTNRDSHVTKVGVDLNGNTRSIKQEIEHK